MSILRPFLARLGPGLAKAEVSVFMGPHGGVGKSFLLEALAGRASLLPAASCGLLQHVQASQAGDMLAVSAGSGQNCSFSRWAAAAAGAATGLTFASSCARAVCESDGELEDEMDLDGDELCGDGGGASVRVAAPSGGDPYIQALLGEKRRRRPKDTKKSYDPKVKAWKEWCNKRGHDDEIKGQLVFEFLMETREEKDWSFDAWDSYVKELQDLRRDQNLMGRGDRQSLREHDKIRQMGENMQRAIVDRKQRLSKDPQTGTLADSYTDLQKEQVSRHFLETHRRAGSGLMHRGMFLGCDQSMVCGDEVRGWRLSDMFVYSFDGSVVGPSPCKLLGFLMLESKCNQTGLQEYGWLGRHINPEVCAVGAIFHWLVWHFHVMKEPVPNFADPESLYPVQLFYGKDPRKELSYPSHLMSVTKAFKACEIKCTKKTHAGRKYGARAAQQKGVNIQEAMMRGRWSNDQAIKSSLNAPPPNACTTRAGFPDPQMHHLFRNVPVPDSVRRQIFPWIEEEREALAQAIADGAEAHATPEKVLEAFDWGRDIVCQDAAILMHVLPKEHKLFKLPVFRSKEFLDWAELVINAHHRGLQQMPESIPHSIQLMGLDVRAAMVEAKLWRQQLAAQGMVLGELAHNLAVQRQLLEQLTQEVRELRLVQARHARVAGVHLPEPSPVRALPPAPDPLMALAQAASHATTQQAVEEACAASGSPQPAQRSRQLMQLTGQPPQQALTASPGRVQHVLLGGEGPVQGGTQQLLSPGPRQGAPAVTSRPRQRALFEELAPAPTGPPAQSSRGAAPAQAGAPSQAASHEVALAPYTASPPPPTATATATRKGKRLADVECNGPKYMGDPHFEFRPKNALKDFWEDYISPNGIRILDDTFTRANWVSYYIELEAGAGASRSTTFQKKLEKVMTFVDQLFTRSTVEGPSKSKATIIEEMEEERRRLGISVDQYASGWCGWLNAKRKEAPEPSAKVRDAIVKQMGAAAAREEFAAAVAKWRKPAS